MLISEILKTELKKITKTEDFSVQLSQRLEFGDYTTNLAFILAKSRGQSPFLVAEDIKKDLLSKRSLEKYFDRIEIKNGYLNFFLSKSALVEQLSKDAKSVLKPKKQKKVIVEYSSPNIAKPFTIGHLRSTIIGDAIANLFEISGWKVLRDNHLGDWGTQFGKMIYAIKAWGDEAKISKSSRPIKELVDLYVKFHAEAEKKTRIEEDARAWFKKLEDGDKEARRIWKKCVNWSFKEFDQIYKVLGISFSKEFQRGRGLGESFFEDKMSVVLQELRKKRFLKKGEEGAELFFFKNEKFPPAMILKKDGATLYHTRDLATDKYRKTEYKPDLVINEVGSEQALYFSQLFEMEKLLGWYKDEQRVHVGHGLINFKDGKMSTRKGNVIWMEEVVNEAISRAREVIKGKSSSLPVKNLEEVATVVGVGAIKYNDLSQNRSTDIAFDWEKMLSFKGNSSPYIQYGFSRLNNILKKANFKGQKLSEGDLEVFSPAELSILRKITQLPEAINEARNQFLPNLIANYVFELSSEVHAFYENYPVLMAEAKQKQSRLKLIFSAVKTIKICLGLLGIETPERI